MNLQVRFCDDPIGLFDITSILYCHESNVERDIKHPVMVQPLFRFHVTLNPELYHDLLDTYFQEARRLTVTLESFHEGTRREECSRVLHFEQRLSCTLGLNHS